jgi:hypothetical protein
MHRNQPFQFVGIREIPKTTWLSRLLSVLSRFLNQGPEIIGYTCPRRGKK